MPPNTKQFKWQDRDTAAQDVLQLVYHAPPYISRLAVRLLKAFRSVAVLPELRVIFLDESQEIWNRISALRAFANTPGDVLVNELEPLVGAAISHRERKIMSAHLRNQDSVYLDPDLLDGICALADKHPANRLWFFKVIDSSHPLMQKQLLRQYMSHGRSEEFEQLLMHRLFTLLELHQDLLNLSTVLALLLTSEEAVSWLDQRFDAILALCLANRDSRDVRHIATQWPRMHNELKKHIEDFQVSPHPSQNQHNTTDTKHDQPTDYLGSPAYQYLMQQYEQAENGIVDAYHQLVRLARRPQDSVPVRAVATHLIGKLGHQYDVFPVLAALMRHGDVDWDIQMFDSPIRYEAGEALLGFASPSTWEVYVDSYFIRPRDDLLSFQIDWITYLSDILSGETKDYTGMHFGNESHRGWFRTLANISADQAKEMFEKPQ